MFLFDTNIVSELKRPERADPALLAWAAGVPLSDTFLSAITVFELELGVLLMERRDPIQGAALRGWFDAQVLHRFTDQILPVDIQVARRCAPLFVPNPRPDRDALIAATALVHGMTVVTRNVRHFEGTGVTVLNPV